ncbi:MAG: ATP-binding protein [Oscillospiraceae bacterium]|jgi:adenylate kinase family enzyme
MASESNHIHPYAHGGEHLADCLAALDALLLCVYRCHGDGEALNAEGMAMTNQEAHRFLNGEQLDVIGLTEETARALDALWSRIRERERASLAAGVDLPLLDAAAEFSLTPFGMFCLLMALSVSCDRKYETIYARFQDDAAAVLPTVGLAQTLFGALWPDEDLTPPRELCFVETDADGRDIAAPLRLRTAVVRFLLGESVWSPELDGIASYLNPDSLDPLFIHEAVKDAIVRLLYASRGGGELLLYLLGRPGTGRKLLLRTVSAETGLPILSVSVERLLRAERSILSLLNAVTVQARLTGSAVHLEVQRALEPQESELFAFVCDTLLESVGLVFVTAAPGDISGTRTRAAAVTFELSEASIEQREDVWRYYAGKYRLSEDLSISDYAGRYYATPDQIRRILCAAASLAASAGKPAIEADDMARAILQNREDGIDALATRVKSAFTWDDLELLPEQSEPLHLACARMRLRKKVEEEWGFNRKVTYGRGVSVLLYGPPGTGKTMAAQVMANDIGMELYRVDLSQIINKYIGETEKNLARIFDVAQKSNVILFFDEADSLFSKRTEVTSSNDRSANNETSYILQRIETYDGITILATNLFSNFDPAFLRRITYAVRFSMPDEEMRLRLWQKNIPAGAPVCADLDLPFFAKGFSISGSDIKQVLLNAAYMAARDDKPIGNHHIAQALKYNLQKNGKMISRDEFGIYY